MLSFIVYVILFCFIVWGIPLIFLKKPNTPMQSVAGMCSTHLVITAKNAEDSIEGIVRSIAWQISSTSNKSFLPAEVFVIDLGSTDCTFSILEKLTKEYTFIHPMHTTDYITYISSLS